MSQSSSSGDRFPDGRAPGGSNRGGIRTIALVGRANAGKTSLAMALTGSVQRPVNFPGTSVERTVSEVRIGDRILRVVDLPGIASLTPLSRDEAVTTEYLRDDEDFDVICAVLDGSKLSVELHLLRDVLRLGRPVVIALNKVDVAKAQGTPVDIGALAKSLGLPIFAIDAFRGQGIEALRAQLTDPPPVPSTEAADFDPDQIARVVQLAQKVRHPVSDRIDAILLHRVVGPLALVAVILAMFQLVFTVADPFVGWVEGWQQDIAGLVEGLVSPGALQSFLVDGIVNGLGSVFVFLPQIVLLIAMVTLLEGSGYLARAAFILDQLLGKFGLSGRSFIPLTSSFACAIPGILAARIISDERDRLATIVVAPLMSCSARLPVYVILIGAFFPVAWAGIILFAMYTVGILVAVLVAWLLRRTILKGGRSPLLMELPAYQWPSWRVVGAQVWSASREFIVLAGSVIFATAIILWLTSYYPRPAAIHDKFEQQRSAAEAIADAGPRHAALARIDAEEDYAYFEQSLLAQAGKTVQPIFAPAGFDWKTTVAILAAFPARELVIPTMGVLHSLGDVDPGKFDIPALTEGRTHEGLREKLRKDSGFNGLIALALMVFFALCSQCAATLGTIRRETRSWRWPLFTFTYMTVLAWVGAVGVYQIGSWMGFGA